MYSQTQKALSILLLTSMLLQSCGTNLMLGEQRSQMREQLPASTDQARPLDTPADSQRSNPLADASALARASNPAACCKLGQEQPQRSLGPTARWHAQVRKSIEALGKTKPQEASRLSQTLLGEYRGTKVQQEALEALGLAKPDSALILGLKGGGNNPSRSSKASRPSTGQRRSRFFKRRGSDPAVSREDKTEKTTPSGSLTPSPDGSTHRLGGQAEAKNSSGLSMPDLVEGDRKKYASEYDQTTLEHLASTLTQRHALTVVFYDENPADPNTSFVAQVRQLKLLTSQQGKEAALFVSKAPGTPHFLFGLMYENNLLILSPEGTQRSPDFYAALAKLKAQGLAEEVFLSSTRLQKEASPASCGPICAELLLHYGAMEEEALEESIGLLYSLAQAREAHGVPYQEVDVTDLLPDTLRALVSEEGFQGHLDALRHHHLERLKAASSKLPEQAIFMQLTMEGKRLQEIEAPEGAQAPLEATVTFEGKRIATTYWYEDREMSSLLQAALKRYSQEVSADRTCYTQADGSTITILGPLDNLSPQGLSEALLAYQRQPGLVLIPFNLGGLHWVGLLLAYAPSGRLVRAEYYDALQGDVPPYLSDALRVHSLGRDDESLREFMQVQAPRLVTQANNSDCGPCTLENLLAHAGLGYTPAREAVRRRYQHLQWLEEAIQDTRDQRYYDDFYRRQQRNESSFKMPVAPSTRKPQGPSKAEEARAEMVQRREKIEGEYAQLLSLASTTIDLPLVEALLIDLQWLLEEEKTFALEEGETSAQAYLLRLKADASLPWTKEQYEMIIELLDKAYGQELRRVAYASPLLEASSRVRRLLTVLSELAALHKNLGDRTEDLSHYTDAATLYQHVLHVCEKEQAHLEEAAYQAQEEVYQHLAQVKGAMLSKAHRREVAVSSEALREEIDRDRIELDALREESRDRIATLEEAEMNDETAYIEGSRTLFTDIADRMAAFLQRLYEESEQEVGPAPCSYTVIGLGSMALKQMTPYSDLEFAILMEDHENEEVLEEHREYFRKLSHLVHLRVINLGETVAPMSKYQFSLDHLGKKGVNFDLGGKTPLGRKDKAHLVKPYELIQPVRGMMRYLRNEDQRMEHMDKLLPFILEATCHVHGDRALYDTYVEEKNSFLMEGQSEQGVSVYKARALQKLLEGVVEMDYRGGGPGITERKQGDLGDFSPNLEQDQHGRLYDVKQEIYRLPDRLLYRLAMYYGVLPESAWDAVLQLQEKGIINEEAARHLQYAASFATILRLRTYTHHREQKEGMAVLISAKSEVEQQQAVRKVFRLPSEALQSGGSFFKYYYTALPLHEKMETFFKQAGQLSLSEETHFFESECFYKSGLRVDARIYERLMQPRAALGCYETLIKEEGEKGDQEELTEWLNNAGLHYEVLGESRKGLAFQEEALVMRRTLFEGQAHPDLASSLGNVGSAYQALGATHTGLALLEEALAMHRTLFEGQAHPHLAMSLGNVGLAYQALWEPRKALTFLEEALAMYRTLFQGQAHPDLAVSLNNVGNAYQVLGEPRKALAFKEEALEMFRTLFEGQAHPHLAMSLGNVGSAYQALEESHKALAFKEEALAMYRTLFPGQAHPHLANSLMSVGSAYQTLWEPRKALTFLEEALAMYRTLFPGQAYPDLAMSLNNVGNAYQALWEPRKALVFLEEALAMYRTLFPGQAHPDLAMSLSNVGAAYQALEEPHKALAFKEEALAMYRTLFPGQAHPHLASSLNNAGNAYQVLGEPRKALVFLEEALAMRRTLFPGQAYPDLAISLGNVGSVYQALEEPRKALAFLEEALAMFRTLFAGRPHPHLATVIHNVGTAYETLWEPRKALVFLEEALAMRRTLLEGQAHPDLASSLDSVGIAYQALEEPRKALAFLEEALAMYRTLFAGRPHPHLATVIHNVGASYAQLGQMQQALTYLREGRAMLQALQLDPEQVERLNQLIGMLEMAEQQGLSGLLHQRIGNYTGVPTPASVSELSATNRLIQACLAGHDVSAINLPMDTIEKDLHDAEGNPLICWMAQHEMVGTFERALTLGWNPNLANRSGIYPLHYGATKRLALTQLLLENGAHPFVETPKGTTPAQAARKKGKMDTLAVLLPTHEALSFEDTGAFERSYEAYKQAFARSTPSAAEALVALEIALQLGDAALAQTLETNSGLHGPLRRLLGKYPLGQEAIEQRLAGLLPGQASLVRQTLAVQEQIAFLIEACRAGDDVRAFNTPMEALEKDLHDAEGNPLVCWMAQYQMPNTLAQVLDQGWNPNLPNTSGTYPLHYGAIKSSVLTRTLLEGGAHPFVQTAKGNTPAQAARKKGKVDTLAVLLPACEALSYENTATFESSYVAYKRSLAVRSLNEEKLLGTLELALQLGDTELIRMIEATQRLPDLLERLTAKYSTATEAIQSRLSSLLQPVVKEAA